MASIPEHHGSSANSPADLLLAVDAGGTKTAAWLVDLNQPESRQILGRGRASAGNPLSVGFDEATRALTEAITAARNDARLSEKRVDRLILSIAGAANESVGKQFVEWVRSLGLAERVAVISDVLPVLAAGTPQCIGIAVIAGTGSVAFGRNAKGKTQLCGGWGYLLGDQGSGYFIGQRALSLALDNLERHSDLYPLAATVLKALGAETVTDVTKAVYSSPDPRAIIASLAPVVIDAAEKHEQVAEGILDDAAIALASLVARTAGMLGFSERQFALAVSGGLLVNSKLLRKKLGNWIETFKINCNIALVDEPLEGCVRLAVPEFDATLVKWQ